MPVTKQGSPCYSQVTDTLSIDKDSLGVEMNLLVRKLKMPSLVLTAVSLSACFRSADEIRTQVQGSTERAVAQDVRLYPVISSFNVSVQTESLNVKLPPPPGALKNAVGTQTVKLTLTSSGMEIFEKLKPLYGFGVVSRGRFEKFTQPLSLVDLFPPAFQAVVNSEFKFDDASVRISSSEALLALMTATAKELRFHSLTREQLSGFLFNRKSYKSFGELSESVKMPQASSKERNTGFAVGDLLAVLEGSRVRHLALWIDHDLYFEAQTFSQSVLFRLATYEQLFQELALRSEVDVRSLRFTALRRVVTWPVLAEAYRDVADKAALRGLAVLGEDAMGRSRVTSARNLEVKLHLPE